MYEVFINSPPSLRLRNREITKRTRNLSTTKNSLKYQIYLNRVKTTIGNTLYEYLMKVE